DTEIPGLPTTVGYLRFQDHDIRGICKLLLAKLSGTSTSSAATAEQKPTTTPDPIEYRTQRNSLPETEIIKKIYSRPRWCIWIRPTEFKRARFQSLDQCKYFMQSSSVRVGSLVAYPFVSSSTIETGEEWIAGEIDILHQLERWNLFRSGQFVHYRTL